MSDNTGSGVPKGALVGITYAAAYLGIARSTAYDLIAEDRFPVPVIKVGDRYKVRRHQLETFVIGDVAA